MFLRKNAVKKLFKEAFRNEGLVVARSDEEEREDGYYIAGSYWKMWFKKTMMPKEVLAQIIELTGTLPENGEVFTATKEGNQYEIADTTNPNLYLRWSEPGKKELKVTSFCQFQGSVPIRFLQAPDDNEIIAINEKFVEMISKKEIDFDGGETEPSGPFSLPFGGVMWGNNTSYLFVYPRVNQRDVDGDIMEEEQRLWEYLEKIELF